VLAGNWIFGSGVAEMQECLSFESKITGTIEHVGRGGRIRKRSTIRGAVWLILTSVLVLEGLL
jgi:hypothetical protein